MKMDNQQNKPQARAETHQATDYYAAGEFWFYDECHLYEN